MGLFIKAGAPELTWEIYFLAWLPPSTGSSICEK
jgi:hypothetical protein